MGIERFAAGMTDTCAGRFAALLFCLGLVAAADAAAGTSPALKWDDVSVSQSGSVPLVQPMGVSGISTVSPLSPTVQPVPLSSGIPAAYPFFVHTISTWGSMLLANLYLAIDPASVPSGPVNVYLGANVPPQLFAPASAAQGATMVHAQSAAGTWYVFNGSAWVPYTGGAIPAAIGGINAKVTSGGQLLGNASLLNDCGVDLYLGVGVTQDEMFSAGRVGMVYTVPCPYSFSASASGTSSNLTLTAHIKISAADTGSSGSIFLAKSVPGANGALSWYFNNGSGWMIYSGSVVAYSTGALANTDIAVLVGANVSGQVGSTYYVGYGLDATDMLNNQKFGAIYSVSN